MIGMQIPQLTPKNIAHFWSKVAVLSDTQCWKWQGPTGRDGYGRFSFRTNGVIHNVMSHRAAYLLCHQTNPGDLLVLHRCDTPQCCNPDHLFLGTDADNADDRNRKGRTKGKLTYKDVCAIRTAYAGGSDQQSIAAAYGITQSNVSRILDMQTWKPETHEPVTEIPPKAKAKKKGKRRGK